MAPLIVIDPWKARAVQLLSDEGFDLGGRNSLD
jgi:hypothetical protein